MPCPSQTMSISVQQILTDAKRLVNRLREHDTTTDNLISQGQALNKKVEAMKQYNEDVNELNDAARQRPRSALAQGIQKENRHIRELQQENKELRALLEEHQSALELIMSKYREHVLKLVMTNKAERSCIKPDTNDEQARLLREQSEKIYEMAAMMTKAILMDDEAVAAEQERQTCLLIENKGLRELLQISKGAGSYMHVLVAPDTDDKGIQTDS